MVDITSVSMIRTCVYCLNHFVPYLTQSVSSCQGMKRLENEQEIHNVDGDGDGDGRVPGDLRLSPLDEILTDGRTRICPQAKLAAWHKH